MAIRGLIPRGRHIARAAPCPVLRAEPEESTLSCGCAAPISLRLRRRTRRLAERERHTAMALSFLCLIPRGRQANCGTVRKRGLLQNLVEQAQEECNCDERLGTEARSAMFESAQRCSEDCLELRQQYTARGLSAGGAKSPREGRHLDSPQRAPRRGGRWGCRRLTVCALKGRHNEPSHCRGKCCVFCGTLPGC